VEAVKLLLPFSDLPQAQKLLEIIENATK